MTEFEVNLATALGGCSFLPGSSHKRFCRNMADMARLSPDKEISLRQRHMMELMAWRYRRQLKDEFVPSSKPLNLPQKVKEPNRSSSKKAAAVPPTQDRLL